MTGAQHKADNLKQVFKAERDGAIRIREEEVHKARVGGWIATGVAGLLFPPAFAIGAHIIESSSVPQIRKHFSAWIAELDSYKDSFANMEKACRSIVETLTNKQRELQEIEAQLTPLTSVLDVIDEDDDILSECIEMCKEVKGMCENYIQSETSSSTSSSSSKRRKTA